MSLSRIDSNSIAANAISSADLAESSITSAKIEANAITSAKIADNAITSAKLPAGSVLQVVQADLASTFSTSSSSATDTGLSASITPSSASNKVLVFLDGHGGQNSSGRSCFYFLVRGSTTIKTGDNLQTGPTESVMPMVLTQLDSPATTSSVTYKIQMRTDGVGTVSLGASGTKVSSLILMEIAA